MRYRFGFCFFAATVLALSARLVDPTSSGAASGRQTQNEHNESDNFCAGIAAQHVAGLSLLSWLGLSDHRSAALWLGHWNGSFVSQPGNPAAAPASSRSRTNAAFASAAAAATVDVTVGPAGVLSFDPAVVTINVGDTVRWTFGSSGHNVISGSSCAANNTFCSPSDSNCALAGTSGTGSVYSHTFNTAGNFPYFCSPHCFSGMTGEVIVQAGPTSTPTPGTGTLQFSAANYAVGEGDVRVTITVTRAGDTSGAASVAFGTIDDAGLQPCSTINGIASPRCDYIYTLGNLTWAAGDVTPKNFTVAIIDDSYAEGNETFRVMLSNPQGAVLGTPSIATVMIIDNDTVNGPNPIDQTNFFVRQQYIDFLGREPDPGGFAGWTSTINNCSGDTTQCDRIHVSQLFYQSDEFQSRGYYVFKFYPVSFPGVPGVDPAGAGHKPDYAQFATDLATVSGFLTVPQLEAAKDQFAANFVARPAFVTRYGSLNNTQFVDTLLATAGVTFTASARQALIDGLNSGTLTRAKALRQIVDSPEVSTKYFNEAYVVMEYFGYLRRDPDALYFNWQTILNNTNDARGMVAGFVNSLEYRGRFGTP